MPGTEHLTAADILVALRRHHGRGSAISEEWAFLVELNLATGLEVQRVDALACNLWRSGRHERVAYEVKVSRSDLRQELAHPEKRLAAQAVAHRWVLATPVGMVREGELPEGAGLVEVDERGVHWQVRGTSHDPGPVPEVLLAAIARRASRAELRLHAAEDAGDLAALVASLREELARSDRRAARAREKQEAAERRVGMSTLISAYAERLEEELRQARARVAELEKRAAGDELRADEHGHATTTPSAGEATGVAVAGPS